MSDYSVYLHIPFCKRKCNYCDFYSAPPTPGAVSSYAKALCNQIRHSHKKGEKVSTVYFGGGTPSLLTEEDFRAIASVLQETFDLSPLTEFTVECNPESVSSALAKTWKECGVNRVSMGVQTFSDGQLKTLGRLHTAAKAKESFAVLRKTGFDNISLDLMMALPHQTAEDLQRDLEKMIALSPEHLSVYLLKIESDSPFGRAGVAEAEDEVQRQQYLLADRILTAAGYEHYEISNFAKPGFRAKHNSVYWQGGEYLAFGPGASGFVDGVRYSIPSDTVEFCRKDGLLFPVEEEIIGREEALREAVFLGLRLSDGIDISLIPPEKMTIVKQACGQNLATLSHNKFALTAEGFLISDYLISSLWPDK